MLKYELYYQILVRNSCTFETGVTFPSESCREAKVSSIWVLIRGINCSVSTVAWAAVPVPVWKSEILISVLVGSIEIDVIQCWRSSEAKFCWVTGKIIKWDVDILPISCTDKSSVLVWHHNLWDFMIEASYSLELSEIVLAEYRNPEEIKSWHQGH